MVSKGSANAHRPNLVSAADAIVEAIDVRFDRLVEAVQDCCGEGSLLSPEALGSIRPLIEQTLRDLGGLAQGCGFMAAPDAVEGTRLYQEWWQYIDGDFQRLELDFDTRSEAYYDYTLKQYFAIPLATGGNYVEGPYIDYLGINEYIFTFVTPVQCAGELVGLVGADVSLQAFQQRLLEYDLDDAAVALVNQKGRVILSTVASVDPGSMLRIPALGQWLASGNRAPSYVNWGHDNRTCTVRLSTNGRLEYKAPDASVNPYLSHTVLLAAMGDGLQRQLDPGAPQEGATTAGTTTATQLPLTLGDALQVFRSDEVVYGAIPHEAAEAFLAVKSDEWARFIGAVTQWDLDMYFDAIP